MKYRNLAELHRRQAERLGSKAAIRFKQNGSWHDYSWDQYRADALACASGLIDAGLKPEDRVGILAENRLEWLVADMGILASATVNVPPHAPLSASQVQFELEDSGVRWVFVSNREQLDKIEKVRGQLPGLKGVVSFDGDTRGTEAIAWKEFIGRGRKLLPQKTAELGKREDGLAPSDLATVIYTSGTTGNPKGVMLTQANLLSNALACQEASPRLADCNLLSWLPYSHIYARLCDHYLTMVEGLTMSLAESPETLVQNLAEVQPTHLSSVPRFYEKVLGAVATADVETSRRRLKGLFGARLQWLSSGGAPLSLPVAEAYAKAGLLVLQGYGLTESSPVITFNRFERHKIGTVGLPIPGVEVRIAPDGEVLTRGPHVMKGYWNNPEATRDAIRDGWLYTGDLGQIDADGFLAITGRKKELLVLSNGKKVVPTFLEGLLVADDCIEQAVVCGEGRPYLTALIVPNWDHLRSQMGGGATGLENVPPDKLARDMSVRDFLQARIDRALGEVSNWEHVKKIVIVPQPWSVAADELTVSLKIRRNVILAKNALVLDKAYNESDGSGE